MNKVTSFLKKKDLYLGIVRYLLAGEMMGYGLLKAIGLQAVFVFPFSAWQRPLEEAIGSQLTWAFIGYSTWFRVLLGLFEFIPAVLLLFRRTTLLGAILLLPMTIGVFLINQAMELWLYTRWLTAGLLLLNCLIFVFEWQKVKALSGIVISKAGQRRYFLLELIINSVVVCMLIWIITYRGYYNKDERNALTGDWAHHHPYEWTLISEKINDTPAPHRLIRSYYQPKEIYSEINDSVNNGGGFIKYALDEKEHRLFFKFIRNDRNQGNYYTFHDTLSYSIVADTILKLEKINDTAGGSRHTWTFRRRIINENRYN